MADTLENAAQQPESPQPAPAPAKPAAVTATATGQEPTRAGMKWYVLRVASNKEEQVRESLERKVRIEGLGDRIGRILVPTAKEKRMKAGQVKITQFSATGPDLEFQAEGTIRLRDQPELSTLSLTVKFKFTER